MLRLLSLSLALLVPPSLALAQDEGAEAEADGVRIFEPAYFDEYDPVNALQLVYRTPGFNPQERDGGRGLSGVRSNILIDGERPPPKGQSVRQQLGEMPIRAIERIELIDAGVRRDIDMQGYQQVVNVVTADDPPAYYEVTAQVRRAGTGDIRHENERNTEVEATGSFSWKGHELRLSGDLQDGSFRSPADFVAIDPADPVQRISSLNNSGRKNNGFELGATFALPGDGSLTFNGDLSVGEFSSSPIALLTDSDAPQSVEEMFAVQEDNRDLSAEYRRPFAAQGSLMLAFIDAATDEESESSLIDGAETRSSFNNRESGETAARLLITQVPTERMTVRTTATTAYNFFEGGFRIFENGVELPIEGSDSRVEEDRRSLEVSVDWSLSDKWTFQGTLGAEAYEIETRGASSGVQTDPLGGILISFRPRPRTTLSFESERRIGQLSFGQFLASSNLSSDILTAGADALEPERSWRHSASYDRRFGDVGVLRFELRRQEVDNPVRQIALSDEIVVAQNTSKRTIDNARVSVEYPFERFGREDLVLGLNANFRQSDTLDPVTGERRDVSGVGPRFWSLQIRRDPGDGPLAWGASVGRSKNGDNFSVRQIRSSSSSHEWGAFVEWEPIDGLKLRTNLDGPRSSIRRSSFFDQVRTPGLDPSFISSTAMRVDRSASFSVEWRRRDHLEVRGSLSTRPEILREESLTPFGETVSSLLETEIARTPRASLRVRVYR